MFQKQKKIEDKKLLPPCNEQKCRFKCPSKISEEDRERIFSNFWSLSNLQRQRDFLLANMESITPQYRYTRDDSHRRLNNAFYFNVENVTHRVCKLFFKNSLAISDRPIRTVIEKKTIFPGGIITEDRRGRHGKHYHIDDAIKNTIREHIQSIPRVESHYHRHDSSRQFIDGGKTVADLHRDYVEICTERQQPHANYLMYNRIFNYEFNISFFFTQKRSM